MTNEIREQLCQMDPEEVRMLCFDHFRGAYEQFDKETTSSGAIKELMNFALKTEQYDKLSDLLNVEALSQTNRGLENVKPMNNKSFDTKTVATIAAIVVFAITGLFFYSTQSSTKNDIQYTGDVLGRDTKGPISGAVVILNFNSGVPETVYTDDTGSFRFLLNKSRLPTQIRVQATGYEPEIRNLNQTQTYFSIRLAPLKVGQVPTPTPKPTSTPEPTPTNTRVLVAHETTATPLPTKTSTSSPKPTSTVTDMPTTVPANTPSPAPTSVVASTNTPTPINPPSPTPLLVATIPPTIIPQETLATPRPISPNGNNLTANTPFQWHWAGEQLPDNHSFEVRIWRPGEFHYGAYDARETINDMTVHNDNSYSLQFNIAESYSVKRNGNGEYLWSVAIVTLDPYAEVIESTPLPVQINVFGGGGSSGSGDDCGRECDPGPLPD